MNPFTVIWILFLISIPVLIVYAIVRRIAMEFSPSGGGGTGLTLEDLKRGSVTFSIAILSAVFANVMAYSLFPEFKDMGGFIVALALTLGILGAGYAARSNPVVGNGLLSGGVLSLIFCVGVRFGTFEPIAQMLIMGACLLVATFLSYWAGIQPDRAVPGRSALNGFRALVAGTVIFIFAILFAVYTNTALNPKPTYPSYSYPRNYSTRYDTGYSPSSDAVYQAQYKEYQQKTEDNKRTTVAIVFAIGILYLVAGLSIRSIAPISAAYVVAGVGSILYVLAGSIDSLGAPAIAGLTGIGTIVLIALAYWKLGGNSHDDRPPTLPGPTLSE